MLSEDRYFQTLSQQELWQRYCGFLDLSIPQFMSIQKELLIDQINRISDSTLGKKIMNGIKPKSIEEFRQIVPLTSYDDYEPYLSARQEEALAEKPGGWCHSSGKGGRFKWIPYSNDFLDIICKRCITCMMLGTTTVKGQLNITPGARLLIILPPPPYASGVVYQNLAKRFSFTSMPPQELSADMGFQERVKVGFDMALKGGIDCIASLASVLVNAGKKFSGEAGDTKFSLSYLHPAILQRFIRAKLKSMNKKRALLPRDMWSIKGVVTGGVDLGIYGKDLEYYWGIKAHEVYGATEPGILLATQSWNKKGMVFFPDNVFLEFIPFTTEQNHQGHTQQTVLLDELQEGKCYEVVITHFYGMPLLRYRMKDIIKVVSLKDEEAGVNLPHVVFERRLGEMINIGGLADLDEKTLWKAITNTGIKYTDWLARKEYINNQPVIHMYIESLDGRGADEFAAAIDQQLKTIDTDYKDIDTYLNQRPVKVTLLPAGAFKRYIDEKLKQGADLAHLKPAHMNTPDEILKRLLELSTGD